ncbi:hypothetical protein PCE1_003409 [Barthelona sp. PCE]
MEVPTIRRLEMPSDEIVRESIYAMFGVENEFIQHVVDILLQTRHQVVGIITDPISPYPLRRGNVPMEMVEDDPKALVSKFGGERPFMCEAYPTYPTYSHEGERRAMVFIGQIMVKTLPPGFMEFPDDLAMVQMFLPEAYDLQWDDGYLRMRWMSESDLENPIDYNYPAMGHVGKHRKIDCKIVKEWVIHDQFASIDETSILYDFGYDVLGKGKRSPPYQEVKHLHNLLREINKFVKEMKFINEDLLPVIPHGRPRWFPPVHRQDQTRLFSPMGHFAQDPVLDFSIEERSLHRMNIERYFITLDWCRVLGGIHGGYIFGDAGSMNVHLYDRGRRAMDMPAGESKDNMCCFSSYWTAS